MGIPTRFMAIRSGRTDLKRTINYPASSFYKTRRALVGMYFINTDNLI